MDGENILGVQLSTLLSVVVIIVIAVVLERLITRYLRSFAKRSRLAPSVTNNLILTFRILILLGATASISQVGGVRPEWVLSFSAIGGAALGFASTKTIGNFIAGIFLLAARPFKVGDYVRIGTVEGIVQEITINYTKVLTIGNNVVSISNLQILDRDLTNYLYESEEHLNLYSYTFEIGFDHSVSATQIAKIFDEVFEKYSHIFPKKPNYVLVRSAAFERVYLVYLYVEHPQDIFILRPRITEEVFRRWDILRGKE